MLTNNMPPQCIQLHSYNTALLSALATGEAALVCRGEHAPYEVALDARDTEGRNRRAVLYTRVRL